MILCDASVLVYAFRADTNRHAEYRSWLTERLASDESFGVSELVLSGFVRVVTHPRIFLRPSSLAEAFSFCEAIRERPNAVPVEPGGRHWQIFHRLCRQAEAKGGLVHDAFFAALAIESGCEWITTDRGYGRFPGLRWHHPLNWP